MQETGNSGFIRTPRITLRIGSGTLSFTVVNHNAEPQVIHEPYVSKSGMSVAANLREAFKTSDLLSHDFTRARVLIDAPVLLAPIEEFDENDKELLYRHSVTGHENDVIVHSILPELNSVAVFAVNRDLKTVLDDHFADVSLLPIQQPVWNYMHHRSLTGDNQKLYGYFFNNSLCIFSFLRNRFRFCNTFHTEHAHDASYFLLYVWQQLHFNAEKDELYIIGEVKEREELTQTLKRYVRKVFYLNPSAEFNRAPITQVKGMTLDLITVFLKGR